MNIKELVGRNLKRYRREAGFSQEALAFECDIHRTYVSGVERGIRNPTITILSKLARPLNIPVARLLEE